MIQSESEIIKTAYVVDSKWKLQMSWDLHPGAELNIKKVKGDYITFMFDGFNEAVELSVQDCRNNNWKGEVKHLKDLKAGYKLWVKEPEKFVFENRKGFGKHWWHLDGKKCKYSYLNSLEYFFSKEDFEEQIAKHEKKIEEFESGSNYKYFKSLVTKHKFEESIKNFNKHVVED